MKSRGRWLWYVVGFVGFIVAFHSLRAAGEGGRHRSPCSSGERLTPDGSCIQPAVKRAPARVEDTPAKSQPKARSKAKRPSGPRATRPSERPRAPGEWVLVKAGSFVMGSPTSEEDRNRNERQHRVTLTRDYWMQATEVTQGQWREVMGNNPSQFGSCGSSCPVEYINWFEAVAYTNALSKLEGLPECYSLSGCSKRPDDGIVCSSVSFAGLQCLGYRLPTEAEWEYAARAGTTESRYGNLNAVAWNSSNSAGRTHPVKGKRPNRWGLYDMLGNVWEWCHDWYGDYPSGSVTDPLGPPAGTTRVYRGSSWFHYARDPRAALRGREVPDLGFAYIGLRPVRSLP